MSTRPDVSKMSKSTIMSELNALNYSNWTSEDMQYRDQLELEYHKRIEDECKNATEGI